MSIPRNDQNTIKILVVDDHPLFRRGVISLLDRYEDIDVVGEGNNGEEALFYARELKPDLILMDIMMPKSNGLQATRKIAQEMPDIKIIMLTVNNDKKRFA